MKKSTLLLTFTAALIGISMQGKAQATASATANATATIVTPISIVKVTDLEFGNVAVSGTVDGTVIMDPDGTRSRTGGVTLPAVTGDFNAASFTVSGVGGYLYTITLPSTAVSLASGASPAMTVTNFTSDPAGSGGTLSTGGEQTLRVGGTLNVAAGQPAGIYATTTPFTVTVNYN